MITISANEAETYGYDEARSLIEATRTGSSERVAAAETNTRERMSELASFAVHTDDPLASAAAVARVRSLASIIEGCADVMSMR